MSSNSSWEVKQIGKICVSIVPGRNKPKEFSGTIPWVTTPEITNRYIPGKSQTLYLSDYWIKEAGAKKVPPGSVIMACVGDLGLVAIATEEVVLNQQLHAFVCPPSVHNEYCAYALEGQKAYMYKIASTTTIPYLNKKNCESIKIPLPPLPEQKAIADLLCTWDEAIEKTERLIQAKEKKFKLLLRELISKPRNIQKDIEWKNVKLGDVCNVTKGTQLNIEHMKDDGEYYVLNGGIEPSGRTDDWNTETETITISEGGNSCGYVNYNSERFWSGGHCYSLLNLKKNVDKRYLYFYLRMHQLVIMKLRVGSGLPNIQKKDVDKFIIGLPSLPKQQIIAERLYSAQREIDLLKKLVEKYKTQKGGLMHKMLTGEWRVRGFAE